MRKTFTLWLTFLLLFAWHFTASAQTSRTDTLKSHYEPCIQQGAFAEGSVDPDGVLSGTWGPADNPFGPDPAQIYAREHGMIFTAPMGSTVRLDEVYVWFGENTQVVNEPDVFNLKVYRFDGMSFDQILSAPFQLDTILAAPFDQNDPLNIYARGRIGIPGGLTVTPGEVLFIAIETKRLDTDDVISLIALNDQLGPGCGEPQRWHALLYDAATDGPWAPGPLPPTFNEFIGDPDGDLGFTNFAIGPVFNVTEVQQVCNLNLTATTTDVTCANGRDGRINLTVGGEPVGPYRYTWLDEGGNTVSNNEDPSGLAPGRYTVIVEVVADPTCSETAGFDVELETLPPVAITPAESPYVLDGRQLTVPNRAGYTWQWFQDGAEISGATQRTFTPTEPGTYYAVGTLGPCTVQSAEVRARDQVQGGTVCAGGCTDLQTSLTGVSYQWSPVTGLDNPTSATPTACPRRTTTYFVRVTDASGEVSIDQVTVTVLQEPNAAVTASGATTFCSGETVTLSALPGLTPYTWRRDGRIIGNTRQIQVSESGLYTVEVSNGECTKVSVPTQVIVVPAVPFTIEGYPFTCPRGNTTLQIIGGEPNAVFTWNPTQGLTIGQDGRVVVAAPNATRTYTVSYQSTNGCNVQRTITVTVSDPIASSIQGVEDSYCSGAVIDTFTVGPPTGGTLTIVPGINPAPRSLGRGQWELNLSNAAPGNYRLQWTGTFNGCDFTTTRTFQVIQGANAAINGLNEAYCVTRNNPVNFTTTPNGGVLSVNPPIAGPFPPLIPSQAGVGVYEIRYTGAAANGCAYDVRRTVTIFQNGTPTVFDGLTLVICRSREPFEINALPGGGTYSNPGLEYLSNVVGGRATFNPNARPFLGNDTTVTITYRGSADGCTFGGATNITITNDIPVLIDVNSGQELDSLICTSSACIPFRPSPEGGLLTSTSQGLTGPSGVPPTYRFCPGIAGEGTHHIVYSGVINDCQFSKQFTLRLNEPPREVAIFGLRQRYCTNEASTELIGVPPGNFTSSLGLIQGDINTGFTYNPSLYTGNLPSVLDEVTMSGRVGGCDYELRRFVTIVRGQSVTITDLPDSICTDTPAFTFTVTPADGQWSQGTFTYIERVNETTYRINPQSDLFVDGMQLTFSYNGIGDAGCPFDTTFTLVFSDPPSIVQILGVPDVVCNITEPFQVFGDPRLGTFSGIGVTPTGNAEAIVDPRVPGAGRIIFQGQRGGCEYGTELDFPIIIAPEIAIVGIEDSVCSRTPEIRIHGIPGGTGSFSAPAGQNIAFMEVISGDSAIIRPSAVPEGTYTIIWAGVTAEGCAYSISKDVVVTDTLEGGSIGVTIIGLPDTVCIGVSQIPLLVSRDTPPGTWREVPGVVILGAPAFVPQVAGLGDHEIVYEGFTEDGCYFFVRKMIHVSSDVTQASIIGLPTQICNNAEAIVLSGIPAGGAFTGGPIVENRLEPSAVAFGTYTITYSGEAGGCSFSATQNVEILEAPVARIIATDPDDPTNPNPTALCGSASRVLLSADPNNDGGPRYSFTWFRNGPPALPLPPGQDTLLTSESGTYRVEIRQISTGCVDATQNLFVSVSTSTLEWNRDPSESYVVSPTGCDDDGMISITIQERFPGERIEYYINGNGPYSSGFNFIEFYKGIDPNNPDFAIGPGVYIIRARDAAGCSIADTIVVEGQGGDCCPNLIDPAIANVEVEDGTATVVWDTPQNSIGVEYQVTDALGVYGELLTTTGTNFALTGLIEGSVYCVRLRSICEEQDGIPFQFSEWDTVCFAFIAPGSCPPVSGSFSFANITASSATVSWTAVREAVMYDVRVFDIADPTVTVLSLTTTAPTAELTGLIPGRSYQVDVRTNCGAGNLGSEASDFFSTDNFCGNVEGVEVINISSVGATVRWNTTPGAIRYEVSYAFSDGSSRVDDITQGTEYFIEGLDCSENYLVTVRAVCSDDLKSSEVSEFFRTAECCSSPIQVQVSDITTSSVFLSWDRVSSANSYIVTLTSLDSPAEPIVRTTTETSLEVIDLAFGTSYRVEVVTVCALDTSGAAEIEVTTSDICENPSSLEVDFATPSTAQISWQPVRGSREYLLEYSVDNAAWTQVNTTMTTYLLTGLDNSTNYFVRVRTICAPGFESSPTSTDFSTLGPCTTPTDLVVSNRLATSAVITWAGSSSATSYSIRYRQTGTTAWTTREAREIPHTLTGLTPETEYEVQVRSICGSADLSGWSSSAFFFTVSGLACPAPEGLRIESQTANAVRVAWDAAANASSYTVQWSVDSPNPSWSTQVTAATSFTITNLTPGTAYLVRVRSACGSLFSDFTAPVRSTTTGGRIGAGADELSLSYSVYPNPNRGRFTVRCEAQDQGQFTLRLVDLTGRVIVSQSNAFVVGLNEYAVDLNDAVAGVYFLHLESGDVRQTLKVIIQ